jgi:hypothetical protein
LTRRIHPIVFACALAVAGNACRQQVGDSRSVLSPTPVSTANVASLLISAGAVNAGGSLQGTVLLDLPAGPTGLNVSLSVSDDAASVDPVVTVPPASASVQFAIATRSVPNDRLVIVTATTPGRSALGTFSVWAETPIFFSWFSEPGDFIGAGRVDRFTQNGATFSAVCDRNYVNIFIRRAATELWTAMFSGPAGVPLRQGIYEGATRSPFNTATPGLSISGASRGCNMLGGRFVIHDIDLQNNRVNRFHASFTQRCDNGTGLLNGDIRVINMPPSSTPASCQR